MEAYLQEVYEMVQQLPAGSVFVSHEKGVHVSSMMGLIMDIGMYFREWIFWAVQFALHEANNWSRDEYSYYALGP